jgi:RNA polymerase sigma-70 factor, ECF subfamily
VEDAIDSAYRAAREAWPDVEVAPERFASEVQRRLPDVTDLAPYCTRDLYLAIACLDGHARAAEILERDILSEADRTGAKLRATADQSAELRGHLRRLLFDSALASYTGRGDLRGYVKVIATRELVRVINRARKEQPIEPLLDRLELDRDPQLSLMRARYGAEIAASMRAALEGLPERERALLRYALVAGWTVDQIGELYAVHRATAARWVAAARDQLAELIRAEVAGRLAIDPLEVDSLIRLLRSRIDISLERVL